MKKNLTLLYRFDIYIYILRRSFVELAPRLERKRIVVPLIIRVYYILYNARTIGTLFFWKLDMLVSRKKEWFISTAGRKETGRNAPFPFSFFFFFEKYPAKYLCGITRADSTDDSEFTRWASVHNMCDEYVNIYIYACACIINDRNVYCEYINS